MKNDVLQGLQTVEAVAERGSFSAAATALGVTPSAVSQAVKQVEDRLGIALFNRTTRSMSLTEAGARLIRQVGPALADIGAALEEAASTSDAPTGLLRINMPKMIYRHSIQPMIRDFMARYPDIRLELFFENAATDIVAEGFDVGIRASEILAKDMIAMKLLGPVRYLIVGSPDYIARHGEPVHPKDLTAYNCLCGRLGSTLYDHWGFETDGVEFHVHVSGNLIINDAELMLQAAADGLGFAFATDEAVHERVAAGELQVVLDDYACNTEGFYLYYPSRSDNQPKLKAFVDHAIEWRRSTRGDRGA